MLVNYGVGREAAAIIFVARQRLTVCAEKTTQVIHSQNAKLKYTGTSRTRHPMPTHGSSGSADEFRPPVDRLCRRYRLVAAQT